MGLDRGVDRVANLASRAIVLGLLTDYTVGHEAEFLAALNIAANLVLGADSNLLDGAAAFVDFALLDGYEDTPLVQLVTGGSFG